MGHLSIPFRLNQDTAKSLLAAGSGFLAAMVVPILI
jgi:hypothetical protein